MTAKTADLALAADMQQRGTLLLGLTEDQWFDRKGPRLGARQLGEVLVGFANADGGTIVIGLGNGRVEGINAAGPESLSGWQQAAMDFTMPTVPCETRLVECIDHRGEADRLLLMRVEASGVVHTTTDDTAFLRVGDETRKLRFDQRRELLADKGQTTYEATVLPDVSVADLDAELLDEYAQAAGSSDPRRLLVARGLVTASDEVTVAAALLFAPIPQTWLPQANVRVVRYRGRERGSGRHQQIIFDVRFDGPLPHQLSAAREAIASLVPSRRALGPEGRFEDMPIIPADAWLEGVVNAVVHRSYGYAGDHIRVEIFDDRVEVRSPGRFPGLSDPADPREVMRFARNPRIARVCAELRFGQELGEGIRRIFDEMRSAGLTDPTYTQTSTSVQLTLSSFTVNVELEQQLMPRQRQLLGLLRAHDGLSTGDAVEASGWSRPVVLRDLGRLRDLGLIEWLGRSRNDPWAYWRVREQTR
ncbi:ATP-binding protein [Candidatus Poriferisodalis sp.]|uniref:ATP-binding protein n=1 Tax=Candidatus Poriferisodalis sp. TaxID=3101277 RepID=UPI003C700C26